MRNLRQQPVAIVVVADVRIAKERTVEQAPCSISRAIDVRRIAGVAIGSVDVDAVLASNDAPADDLKGVGVAFQRSTTLRSFDMVTVAGKTLNLNVFDLHAAPIPDGVLGPVRPARTPYR